MKWGQSWVAACSGAHTLRHVHRRLKGSHATLTAHLEEGILGGISPRPARPHKPGRCRSRGMGPSQACSSSGIPVTACLRQ